MSIFMKLNLRNIFYLICAHALKQKGAASVTGLVIASGAP